MNKTIFHLINNFLEVGVMLRKFASVLGGASLLALALACGGGGGDSVATNTGGGTTNELDISGTYQGSSVAKPNDFALSKASNRSKVNQLVQLVNFKGAVLASTSTDANGQFKFSDSSTSLKAADFSKEQALFIVHEGFKTIVTKYKGVTNANLNLASTAVVAKIEKEFAALKADFSKGKTSQVSTNDEIIAFKEAVKRGVEYKTQVVDPMSDMLTEIAGVTDNASVTTEVQKYYNKVIAGDETGAADQIQEIVQATTTLESNLITTGQTSLAGTDVANKLGQVSSLALSTYEIEYNSLYQGYLIDSVSRQPIAGANLVFSNGIRQVRSLSAADGFFVLRGIPSHSNKDRFEVISNVIKAAQQASFSTQADASSFYSTVGTAFNSNGQPVINGDTFLVKIEKDNYFTHSQILNEISDRVTDLGVVTMTPAMKLQGKVLSNVDGQATPAVVWGWMESMGDWVNANTVRQGRDGLTNVDPLLLNNTPYAETDATGMFTITVPVADVSNVFATGTGATPAGNQTLTLQVYRKNTKYVDAADYAYKIEGEELLNLYKSRGNTPGQTVEISPIYLEGKDYLGTVTGQIILKDSATDLNNNTLASNVMVHYYTSDSTIATATDNKLFGLQGHVMTDMNGVYTIPANSIPYGKQVFVSVLLSGYTTNTTNFTVNTMSPAVPNTAESVVRNQNIVLTKLADANTYGGSLVGYVYDYKTGKAVEGATVQVYTGSDATATSSLRQVVTTGANGNYTVSPGLLALGAKVSVRVTKTNYIAASQNDAVLHNLSNSITGETVATPVFMVPVDVTPIAPMIDLSAGYDSYMVDSTGIVEYYNASQVGRALTDTTKAIKHTGIPTELAKEKISNLVANTAVKLKVTLDNNYQHTHEVLAIGFDENGRTSGWSVITPVTALTNDGYNSTTVNLSAQMAMGNTTYVTVLPSAEGVENHSSLSVIESELNSASNMANFLKLTDTTGIELSGMTATGLTKFDLTFTENLTGSDDKAAGLRAAADVALTFNNTTVWEKLGGNTTKLAGNVSFVNTANTATAENKVYATMGTPMDTVMFGDAAYFYTIGTDAVSATNTITLTDWKGRYDGNDAAPSIYLVNFDREMKVVSSVALATADYVWTSNTGTLVTYADTASVVNYNAVVVTATAPVAGATLTAVTGGAEYFSTSDNTSMLNNGGNHAIVTAAGNLDHVHAGLKVKFTFPTSLYVDNTSVVSNVDIVDVVTSFGRDSYSMITFNKDLQTYANPFDNAVTVVEHGLTSKLNIDTTNSSFRARQSEGFKTSNGQWNQKVILPVATSGIALTNGGNATLTATLPTVTIDTAANQGSDNLQTVFTGTQTYELYDLNGGRLQPTAQLAASVASTYTDSATSIVLTAAAANTQAGTMMFATQTELDPFTNIEISSTQAHQLLEMTTAKFDVTMLRVADATNYAVGDNLVFTDVDFGVFTDADGIKYSDTMTAVVTDVNTIDNVIELNTAVNLRKYDMVSLLGDVVKVVTKDGVGNAINEDANEINLSNSNIK